MSAPAAHTRVEAGKPEYFQSLSAERLVSIAAAGLLVASVFVVYARGFISLSADEFAKAVVAWDGLDNPRLWFRLIWLPGHFPLLAMAYIIIGDLLTATRFLSVLGGVVVVVGVYRLSKQMDAGWAGAIATILCATHPLVVLLSATGLVEVLYAGAFILGLSCYVQQPRTLSQFYVACALFALSCTFHYNAWLAVAPVGAAMLLDFIRGKENERRSLFVGLSIIASFPFAWFIWNWLQHGSPLSFLSVHIEESTREYETWGAAAPSLKFSLYWMKETALRYSPILAGLSVTSIAGLLTAGEKRKPLMLMWSVLFVFVAGLILLFTNGGLSTAYPARHLLLPSLLMAVMSAHTLARLLVNPDPYVRVSAVLLLGIAVSVNFLWMRHPFIAHDKIREAVLLGESLRKDQRSGKVLVEARGTSITNPLRVFVNNPGMIIEDTGGEKPETSVLMQPEEMLRQFARENGIDRIAVWSDSAHTRAKEWRLRSIARAGSYSLYSLD